MQQQIERSTHIAFCLLAATGMIIDRYNKNRCKYDYANDEYSARIPLT